MINFDCLGEPLPGSTTLIRFFKKNQNQSIWTQDSSTAWCRASPNYYKCLLLIPPTPISRSSTVLVHSHTFTMEPISHVALQAFTDIAPFSVDTPWQVSITVIHICSTLIDICETKQGEGTCGSWNHHLSQMMLLPIICTHEVKRGTFCSFFGMKFSKDALKSLKNQRAAFSCRPRCSTKKHFLQK